MNFFLAANPVGALPEGLLTLSQLLASLVVIYVASKIGGELALKLKQPQVLGELVAGGTSSTRPGRRDSTPV